MKKFIKMIVALVLCVSTTVCTVIPASAARGTSSTLYLSELMMAYGDTKQEAKTALQQKGYSFVDVNLNQREATDSKNDGKKYVYLGYKATTDPKNAITDISAINMNGDYTISMYEEVLHDSYSGMVKMGKYYENMAKAFKKNYDGGNGTDTAKQAFEILNLYYDPVSKKKLSDFFIDGKLFLEDGTGGTWKADAEKKTRTLIKDPIVEMLAEANPDILEAIGEALALSTASSSKTDNVYTRLSALTQAQIDAEVASNALFDKADIILETVEGLGSLIKQSESYMEKVSKESANFDPDEAIDEMEMGYASAYSISLHMKEVKVGNRTLYDIVTSDSIKQQDLYPLIKAMNPGQFDAFVISGSSAFFMAEFNVAEETELDEAEKKDVEKSYKTLKDYVQKSIDLENILAKQAIKEDSALDIYSAVDRSVFKGSVGVTDNANASMALDPGRNPIFGNINRGAEIALLSGFAASLATVVTVGIFMRKQAKIAKDADKIVSKFNSYQSKILEQQSKIEGLNVKLSNATKELDKAKEAVKNALEAGENVKDLRYIEGTKLAEFGRISEDVRAAEYYKYCLETSADRISDKAQQAGVKLNSATAKLTGLKLGFKVAIGILVIITGLYAGLEFWNYYHPHLKDIPMLMMDKKFDRTTKTDKYVIYKCVRTTKDEAGDVNALDELQWIALYYTKDKNSGGSPLKVQSLKGIKTNFTTIHTFGSTEAYNLNQFLFGSDHPIVNLSFENGDRNLIVASTFSEGAKHALVLSVGLLTGFGLAFATSMIVFKRKKKNEIQSA